MWSLEWVKKENYLEKNILKKKTPIVSLKKKTKEITYIIFAIKNLGEGRK